MLSSSSPIVAGIGSCRITTPLTILQRRKKIVARHGNIDWYTHSTRDALQKMEIVTGRRELTAQEVPLVVHGMHKWHPEAHRADLLSDADCFVIEIASVKLTDYRGLEIQQWCLRDLLVQEGVPVNDFNKALAQPVAERNLDFLSGGASDFVRDIGTQAISTKQDAAALTRDLERLGAAVGRPIIFVPHINVEGSNGALIGERVLISDTLRAFCEARGHLFFDPAVHVRAYGLDRALKDLGHYTPEFEAVMAEHLEEAIAAVLHPALA